MTLKLSQGKDKLRHREKKILSAQKKGTENTKVTYKLN